MSDAREALVALLHNEGDGGIWEHFDRKNSEAVADAILAAGWTPPGERVKPSEDDQWWESLVEAPCDRGHVVFIDDGDGGVYACPVCRLSELRAEVERLRAVSAAQPYETERELAVALDEARRQLADLRSFASWLVSLDDDNPDSPGRQERRTVTLSQIIDRARVALAGSGEQPGEGERAWLNADPRKAAENLRAVVGAGEQPGERDATPDEAHDIGYSKGHADGYREAMAERRPAPVVPDSADVLREAEAALIRATKGDDPTAWAGTGWWHVHRLLAVVGQDVTVDDVPEQIARYVEATATDLSPGGYRAGIATAVRLIRRWRPECVAARPSGQEGS